MDFDYEPGVL